MLCLLLFNEFMLFTLEFHSSLMRSNLSFLLLSYVFELVLLLGNSISFLFLHYAISLSVICPLQVPKLIKESIMRYSICFDEIHSIFFHHTNFTYRLYFILKMFRLRITNYLKNYLWIGCSVLCLGSYL